MKALLVFVIALGAALALLAGGTALLISGASPFGGPLSRATEPAALLLSGSALLGIAGAVRRLSL
jgi:hypothetical protein